MEEFESLLVVMVVIWVMGKIFRTLKLPVIFGELLGGILVGPLVFGLIDADTNLIKVLAELGIFFLMLHTGLETDPQRLMKCSKRSILVAIGGLILPFIGTFYFTQYYGFEIIESLFIALGVSATAISISVRVFKDFRLQKTKVATTVLGAAILSDIIIIIVFSVLLKLAENQAISLNELLLMFGKVFVFFFIVIFGGLKVQKYVNRFLKNKGFTLTLIVALGLGLFAEFIGLHLIIGAFLAGLFIREEVVDKKLFKKIEDRIYGLSYGFLGPIFFTSLAFNLEFEGLFGEFGLLLSLFVIAFLGKFIGSGLAGVIQKFKPKQSLMIGLAMNSRGAVDLIIASIGLEYGIINQNVFSILVFVAFFTTILAIFIMKPLVKFCVKS